MTMIRETNVGPAQTTTRVSPDIVNSPPRSAWEIIEDVCNAHVTGELTLTTASPTKTKVYMTRGLVYFAERETDDTLATRLVLSGAINLDQLQIGAIRLNCVEHLGRMFERDATIERDAVELAVELITEMTLTDIADQPVLSHRLAMYRHHPSGIARWFSSHQSIDEELTPYHGPDEPAAHDSVEEQAVVQVVEQPVEEGFVEPDVEGAGTDLNLTSDEDETSTAQPLSAFTDEQFHDEQFPDEQFHDEQFPDEPFTDEQFHDESFPETTATTKPEPDVVAAPPSQWEAPTAVTMAFGSMEMPLPTMPTVASPPNMRISQQQPTARTLPAVLAAAGPTFAIADDAPRLLTLTSAAGVAADQEAEPLAEQITGDAAEQTIEDDAEPKTDFAGEPNTDFAGEPVSKPSIEDIARAVAEPTVQPSVQSSVQSRDASNLAPLYATLRPMNGSTQANVPAETPAEAPISDPVLAALASMKPLEPLRPLLPSSSSLASLTSPVARPTMTPITSIAPATPTQMAPCAVHTLESIPVPEDVAAAVRRAIAAIEAATFAPTGPSLVSFGPMRVISVGQSPTTTDLAAPNHHPDTTPNHQPTTHPHPQGLPPSQTATQTAQDLADQQNQQVFPGFPGPQGALDPMIVLNGDNAMSTLSILPQPPQVFASNPVAAPITTARRGALRRLIDGIRRR